MDIHNENPKRLQAEEALQLLCSRILEKKGKVLGNMGGEHEKKLQKIELEMTSKVTLNRNY